MQIQHTDIDDPRRDPVRESPFIEFLAAAFARGIDDLSNTHVAPQDRRHAWAWFRHDGEEVGSFRWQCYLLGFDPDVIRAGVERNVLGKSLRQRERELSGKGCN